MPGGNFWRRLKKPREVKPHTEETSASLAQKAEEMKAKLDQTCRQLDILFKQNALETAKLGPRPELLGMTPLSVAAKVNYMDAVIRLLAANADVNEKSNDGSTALMQATIGKFYNTMEILLKRGADPAISNNEGNNTLMLAVTSGDAKVLNGIWPYRSNTDINHANNIGHTALHIAAELRWESCVQFLILNGADVNKRCNKGRSALFLAVSNEDLKCAERLVSNHCNILLEDRNLHTAICRAVDLDKHEIAHFLLNKLTLPERDYFVKTRIERLRSNFSEDLANGMLFHVLLATRYALKDSLFKYKLLPNLVQMSQKHIAEPDTIGCVMALCYMLMYDPDAYVDEPFVIQFMRAHGQELALKALKCNDHDNLSIVGVEHIARIFLPFVALSETREGEIWLEKNWIAVARYTEFLKANSGMESIDDCCKFHGREMWQRFSTFFEGIQRKYHKQNAAELLEEEIREQEQQLKRKEKKRQKRQKQREWKMACMFESDSMVDTYNQKPLKSEVLESTEHEYQGDRSDQDDGNDGETVKSTKSSEESANEIGVAIRMKDTYHVQYVNIPEAGSPEEQYCPQTNLGEECSDNWITVESKKSFQVKTTNSKTAKTFGSPEKNGTKKRNGQSKKKANQKSSPVRLQNSMKWSDVAKGNIIPNNPTWGQVSVCTETKPENDMPDYEEEFPSLHGKEKSDMGYVLTSFDSMTDVASESACSGLTVDFDNEMEQDTEHWDCERSTEENECQSVADVCTAFTDGCSGVCGVPRWTGYNLKATTDYYMQQSHFPPYSVTSTADQVSFHKPVESLDSIANSLAGQQPMESLDSIAQSIAGQKKVHASNSKSTCPEQTNKQAVANRQLFSQASFCKSVAELEELMKEDFLGENVDVHKTLSSNSVQEYLNRCEHSKKGRSHTTQDECNMAVLLNKVIGGNSDPSDSRSDTILFPEHLRDGEKCDASKDDLPYPETRDVFPGFYDSKDSLVGKGVIGLTLENLAKKQVLEHYKYLTDNSSLKDNAYFHDFYYYASLYGLTMNDLEQYFMPANEKLDEMQLETPLTPSLYSQAMSDIYALSMDPSSKMNDDNSTIDNGVSGDDCGLVAGNAPTSPHKLAEAKWTAQSRRWKDKLRKVLELPMTMRTQYSKIVIPIRTQDFNINPNGNPVVVGFLTDGSEVAVKIMDGTRMTVNKEVVKQLAQSDMNFNFLLRYKALAEVGNKHFLAMELCDYTLQEYIKIVHLDHKHDPLSVNRLAWQLLKGIKYLHDDIGIVHGNLKPDNIFVDSEGKLRVGGYGIVAKDRMCRFSVGQAEKGANRCWQATEILMENDEDAVPTMTSDIQVVGMLLYYILSGGHHPYGQNPYEIEVNMCLNSAELTYLNEEANDLICSMLFSDVDARPSIDTCLRHPYFWSDEKRFRLVLIVGSDVLKEMKTGVALTGNGGTKMTDFLNVVPNQAVSDNWMTDVHPSVIKEMRAFRQYKQSLSELVLFVYNCCLHFDKMSRGSREALDDPCKYFLAKFPFMFMAVYRSIKVSDRTERTCYKPFF